MDKLMKYFIGGSVALMAFLLLAPTIVGFLTTAQEGYDTIKFVDNTSELETFFGTKSGTESVNGFEQLNSTSSSGSSATNDVVNSTDRFVIVTEISDPDNSSLELQIPSAGDTFQLEDGENTIDVSQYDLSSGGDFQIVFNRDSTSITTPKVDSYEGQEVGENEFSDILGLLFILFVVVGVWNFYRSV